MASRFKTSMTVEEIMPAMLSLGNELQSFSELKEKLKDTDLYYTLSKATTTVLGGVKIGTGLSIDADGLVSVNINGFVPATELPLAAGTAAKGSSNRYAREDHVHPLQTTVSGSSGSCTGNAATATSFQTAQDVTLTGDVTGSASSTAGWEIETTLKDSGVTAGSYGPSANATPGYGATFNVPYITVDAKGRVTSASTKTIKIPASDNTNTTYTLTQDTTDKHKLTFSGSDGTSITITTPDTNTTYTLASLGIGNVKNYDQSKAISSINRSGTTFTYTCLDGTTGTFTQQDNNTTYSNFVKSGSGAKAGLVPAPSTTAGTTKYLREDGTWTVPPNTTYTFTNAAVTLAWGTTSTIATVGGTNITVALPANPNTDTHWTSHLYAGGSGATANAATSNGSTYLSICDNSSSRNSIKITGSGATTVTSDANGVITISSTNTTYTPASATPLIAGTGTVGTSAKYAREDHVHPVQTTISGNAGSATKLTVARTIDGVNFNGSEAIAHYGSCSTAAATVEKVVDCTSFKLVKGSRIIVTFTVTNTAANPTLNVNSTGAKAVQYRKAAISAGYLAANRTYEFVYDGTQYQLVGDINTDTNTVYTHPTTSGNKHIPSGGSNGQFLGWSADGTAQWVNNPNTNTTYSAGTGLTLSGTTFSVTANTYAAYSHTHSNYLTAHQSLANYVTLNGAQTITACKTFKLNNQYIRPQYTDVTKGTNPSATHWSYQEYLDSAGTRLGWIGHCYTNAGDTSLRMEIVKQDATTAASMGIGYNSSKVAYTWAPNPPAANSSTQIATTAWVMDAANRRQCLVGQSGSTSTNPWYKFASFAATVANDDPQITFYVEQTYSSRVCGILRCHVRLNGSIIYDSCNFDFLANTGLDPAKFMLVTGTAAKPTIELWVKIDSAYLFYRFVVISEGKRTSNGNVWTLYNASSAGQAANPTSGTQVTATIRSVSNKAVTLAWNTNSTIATVNGAAITVKLPANPNTNTTYSAGTGLTLSGTTFSVTANTYAAYSHTHSYLPLSGGTLTGDVTVNGVLAKNATSIVKGTNPSSTAYWTFTFCDKNGTNYSNNCIGMLETSMTTAGVVSTYIRAMKNTAANSTCCQISCIYDTANNIGYTSAPTPSSNTDSSTKIATTAWVRSATGNTSLNAATATKLQTARTINGMSFDGSANITIADSTKLPLSGGTLTSSVGIKRSDLDISNTTTSSAYEFWHFGIHDKNSKSIYSQGIIRNYTSGFNQTAIRIKDINNHWGDLRCEMTDGGSFRIYALNSSGVTWTGWGATLPVQNTVYPYTDNSITLGSTNKRWKVIYAATATINTSDIRLKQDIQSIPDAILDAWSETDFIEFKFKDAVQVKGQDAARKHCGLIAQSVQSIFTKHNLDVSEYGLFCYDEYEACDIEHKVIDKEAVYDDNGDEIESEQYHYETEHKEAGNIYSLRYEEALCLEAAYLRRENKQLKSKIAELEERLRKIEELLKLS